MGTGGSGHEGPDVIHRRTSRDPNYYNIYKTGVKVDNSSEGDRLAKKQYID